MKIVVVIDDREAVPVRAIPLLTNWETMSPDLVVRALSWDEDAIGFEGLQAFWLDEGRRAVPATWWENVARRQLKALSDSIKAVELTHETGLQEWRRRSLKLLPAGVYVWKDEFEPMHCRRYGTDGTTLVRKGVQVTEEEHERLVALDFSPFIPDKEMQRLVMEGFEQPTHSKAEEAAFVLGFYGEREKLKIKHWAEMAEVQPLEAARLLCGEDPLSVQTYADSAEVKMLQRIFEDLAKVQPAGRALLDWAQLALDVKAKHLEEISRAVLHLAGNTLTPLQRAMVVAESSNAQKQDSSASLNEVVRVAPVQRSAAQDAAILAAIRAARYDPLALPVNEPGKAGVKSKVRAAVSGNPLFVGATIFDKAWERLRSQRDIADKA